MLVALAFLIGLFGCGDDSAQAPAGLTYGMTSAVYATGQAIAPNAPSASGGKIDGFAVSPALPAGLSLNGATGVISGTPAAVSPATTYVVTASNAGGSATARVQIEVRAGIAAPSGLAYREAAVTYTVGQAIAANTPASTGGPIRAYAITPALPGGLMLDAGTGVISGTPTTATSAATYTVTGTNEAGSVTSTLDITVSVVPVAPTSLSYATPDAVYVTTEVIAANVPAVVGGTAGTFSIAPALPAGLSLNTATGAISGTPVTLQGQTAYTVTVANAAGSVQTPLMITVTARGSLTAAPDILASGVYLAGTLLNNGKVLASGGALGVTPRPDAELYDPVLNTWTATGSMNRPRDSHTLTTLLDGRVLAVGGEEVIHTPTASADLYDPATGTWTVAASMSTARIGHTATLLPDGRVLVIGGANSQLPLHVVDTAEIYDPVTNTWTPMTTRLAAARMQHAAILMPGGTAVLLLGGLSDGSFVATTERLAVNDSGTTTLAPIPLVGNYTQAVRLLDGNVLVVNDSGATSWVYNPIANTWTGSAMSALRRYQTLTLLADGRVFMANGTRGNTAVSSTEIFNPGSNVWTAGASLSVVRRSGAAVRLNDGDVLVFGGDDATIPVAATERYRP